jgi:hypothetical protein
MTLAALALLTLAIAAPSAQATSIPVPLSYYGVNFQRMAKLGPAAQDAHLASIASLGIRQVRFNVSWAAIEPIAPKNGVHEYRWGLTDQEIAAMARRGISPLPTLTQTPDWNAVQGAWVDFQCAKSASRSPVAIDPTSASCAHSRAATAGVARSGRRTPASRTCRCSATRSGTSRT